MNNQPEIKKEFKFHRKINKTLTIVGLPIGNFDDFSSRGLNALKECDLILCEDTRSAIILMKNFNLLDKELISYVGSWNKAIATAEKTFALGKKVALICDKGMIGVCDPGAKVVAHFRKSGVLIDCVPGPSAATTAFALSGYFGSFIFHGFLPRKKNDTVKLIEQLSQLPYNLIFFESPLRLNESLSTIAKTLPGIEITIARELTKTYQEVLQGKIEDFINHEFKGECVLIIKQLA